MSAGSRGPRGRHRPGRTARGPRDRDRAQRTRPKVNMTLTEYVRTHLTEFVGIPSTPATDMRDILRAATASIEELGLKPTVHADVKAVSASSGSGGILFNGHLDTVPIASGWTRELGSWDGDFLYGRGTADMKSGCVAGLAAARAILDAGIPVSLLFTTDEETTMHGGTKPNLVADTCSADLDCRHPPGTTKTDVEALLHEAARDSGERVRFEQFHEVPPAAVSAAADHVRLLRDLAGTEVVGVAYGTEMAYYASHNPRSLVFGPGETERIHVPDERVALSEVVRAAEILTAFGTKISSSRNTATRPDGRSRT